MLQHVWERASQARYLTSVVIATDDERIRDAAEDFRARVVMTRADHASGTDRVAEAASASTAQIIVNIQGDEPMIDPAAIDAAVLGLLEHDDVPMGTLKKRIDDRAEITDPNVVKVVTDHAGQRALFFALAHSLYTRERADPRLTSNTSDCTSTGAISCSAIPICPSARSNKPSAWNSCARSKTASRSAWSKPSTNRSASTRPKIGTESRLFTKKWW